MGVDPHTLSTRAWMEAPSSRTQPPQTICTTHHDRALVLDTSFAFCTLSGGGFLPTNAHRPCGRETQTKALASSASVSLPLLGF